MLGSCGFEAFVMRDIHRVDEDVSHIGLSSLLDVVPCLGEVGTRRIRFRHAGQRPHLGERIARDLHRRLRHRPFAAASRSTKSVLSGKSKPLSANRPSLSIGACDE